MKVIQVSKELKLYFYRHNPFFITICFVILAGLVEYLILQGDNIETIKEALSVNSNSLIYQNFTVDMIMFLAMVYYIYCSASSIINDKKNGVFIYSFVKNIRPVKILINKLIAAYSFVVIMNVFLIFLTSIVTVFIYGGQKELVINSFVLLITKSYTSIFYVTLSILFALLINNYVLVLSILFIIEITKMGLYIFLEKFAISKFIVLNHLDISYFFNLPSTGIDRGYTLTFTLLIYMVYIIFIQITAAYIINRKKGSLI